MSFRDLPPEMKAHMLLEIAQISAQSVWNLCRVDQATRSICKSITLPFLQNRIHTGPGGGAAPSNRISVYEAAKQAAYFGAANPTELQRELVQCLLYGWMEWSLGNLDNKMTLLMVSSPGSLLYEAIASPPSSLPLGEGEGRGLARKSVFRILYKLNKSVPPPHAIPPEEFECGWGGPGLDLLLSWAVLDDVMMECLHRGAGKRRPTLRAGFGTW